MTQQTNKEEKNMKINFKGVFTLSEHIRILKSVKNWNLKEITIKNNNDRFLYDLPNAN